MSTRPVGSIKFLGIVNGYNFRDFRLSPESRAKFDEVIAVLRPFARNLFKQDRNRFEFDRRFADNEAVILRLESALRDDAEFLAQPEAWVLDALRCCAEADYWYCYEKQW